MIRVLHAADLHLDSAFEALSDAKAAQRRTEQRELLLKMAKLAETSGAQILLLAGDLLDSESPYMETVEIFQQVFGSLKIPVFISPGNHDYWSSRSPYARIKMPENVHIFQSETIRCVELPELGVRVWGAGFTGSSASPLLSGFRREKSGDLVDIMLMHGQVGAKDSVYNPITEEELACSGMDYVALGHVHAYSGPRRAGNTWYAWPGCTEGRGFDELGEKGVILADVGIGRCEISFIPLAGRRYEIVEVDITNTADVAAAVAAAVPDDSERDVFRIVLKGECSSEPDISGLYRQFSPRFFQLQIRDKTTLRRDVWEKAGEDTLRGLFLTKLRRMYEAETDEKERDKIVQAARWGLRALENGEELYTL
ncbi:MAG: metallophosphoesterase family protein [Dethiobacteria bacterium]|jgi:exonuclease SbcD